MLLAMEEAVDLNGTLERETTGEVVLASRLYEGCANLLCAATGCGREINMD